MSYSQPILKLSHVETYYGLICALQGVSLEVQEGSITTILGNNGAGKSTILKTIMGLLEDQPDKGEIEFCGTPIHGRQTEEIVRMGISFVPEGREIFAELSVRENLLMGGYTCPNRRVLLQALDRIFAWFPLLKERQNQLAGTLSGGQQQMLAIGRALMNQPKLLLMDEPSLGLSPILVQEIFRIIPQINREGITIVLVEQNARQALKIAHDGYVLENGRFVLAGPSHELMEDRDVQEFYLGIKAEASIKGYQRWKRKKRWR
ncbi:MAG: ABC transporter ATP-binding protein [Calditrichaeota bacterium]|nr:MAG: ABC transporter ATP-binding protein [Calditrichota bacterium]